MSREALALDQARLLSALWRLTAEDEAPFSAPGLKAYRNNAAGIAERALAAAYPVLRQCLGEDSFAWLARDFWHDQPPVFGDLACWGEGLSDWLASRVAAHGLPDWMPALAQGEWRLHAMATLADADAAPATLARLVDEEPERLRLQLAPGASVLRADMPLVSLLHVHGAGGALAGELSFDEGLAEVGQKLRRGEAEVALFWREGWRPRVRCIGPDEALWIEALLQQAHLGAAMAHTGEVLARLDVVAWLQQAVETRFLLAVLDA